MEIWNEEMSAIYDKHTLLHMYHEAVSEPYSFLYVNMMQKGNTHVYVNL